MLRKLWERWIGCTGADRAPLAAGGQHRGRTAAAALGCGLQLLQRHPRSGQMASTSPSCSPLALVGADEHRQRARIIGPDRVADVAAVPAAAGSLPLTPPHGEGHDGLLTQPRQAAPLQAPRARLVAPPAGLPPDTAGDRRSSGIYYYLLPAWRRSPWQAVQSDNWSGPLVHRLVGVDLPGQRGRTSSARCRSGPGSGRPAGPGASSFVNRVSPANVGGIALNARFLQTLGVTPAQGGRGRVNSSPGMIHLILIVIFFPLVGQRVGKAFKLPSTSTLLRSSPSSCQSLVLLWRPARAAGSHRAPLVPSTLSRQPHQVAQDRRVAVLVSGSR